MSGLRRLQLSRSFAAMRRPVLLPALLLALAVAGCAEQVAPYESIPRAPRRGANESVPRIGVCYNAVFSRPEEVRAVAEEACGTIGKPVLAEQDLRLACPLLTPTRATFMCVAEE